MKRKISQGWREIGGKRCYFRSLWEANYARYLEWLKANDAIADWEHEPHTFWFDAIKRGVRSYKPDYKVTEKDGSHWWAEVKGYMDPRSNTKLKRMAKYHPKEDVRVIDKTWFSKNNAKMRSLIAGWETGQQR